ncbi:MAG: hypothetical protein M3347_13500 [Armatimonadota bacterium]|nr:hypothetical protein [Armatimonadota bacterium]
MAKEQDKRVDSDALESVTPAPPPEAREPRDVFPADSPSSERDAGLDDELLEEDGGDPDLIEDDLNGHDRDFNDNAPPSEIQEIPIADLAPIRDELESPELADLNVPGEIDIEELDDDALDNTDLPPDARLDPIEE